MTERKLHNYVFWITCILVACIVGPVMFIEKIDDTLAFSFITLFFITVCLGFCFWWLVASRNPPSMMFKIVVALFFSNFYFIAWGAYSRYVSLFDFHEYMCLRESYTWTLRYMPMLLVFIWLFSWIASRIFGNGVKEEKSAISKDKLKVLVVEDEEGVCTLIARIVESLGVFEAVCCTTPECANEVFKPDEYICAILDMRLKSTTADGLFLAEYIRSKDPYIFIGIVSGYFDDTSLKRLIRVVDDFIQKPFDMDTFRLKVLLWTIQYRERLKANRGKVSDSYFQREQLLQTVDEKLKVVLEKGEK